MTTFTVPSSREPVTYIDPSGKTAFSRSWFLFFQGLFERVGGASGTGTSDLAESIDDGDSDTQLASQVYALTDEVRGAPPDTASADLYALADELRGLPPDQPLTTLDLLLGELNDLRSELTELRKAVEGIQQGTTL